jgi:hypothetical protein
LLLPLLIPINLNKIKREGELHIYNACRADLQTQQEFTLEVKRWKARWELYPTDQVRPSHLCETLELVNKKIYPHLLYFENLSCINTTKCHPLQQQPKDLSVF